MNTLQYIDALKKKLGISSDYAIAKALNVPRATVSNYRTGRSAFEARIALRVAELLEIDAGRVLVDMEIERARDAQTRTLWKRIASKVAAGVVVAIGAGAAPSSTIVESVSAAPSVYYVKRRAWWLFPLLPPVDGPDLP